MKQEIDKKIMFTIMIIAIVLLPVYKIITSRNTQIDKRINEINRKQFAMYIEDENGYREYTESDEFPDGYYLNLDKSKCEDMNGNKLDVSKILSSNGNSITLKSSKTVYCTLYFDNQGTGEKENPYKIQYIEDLVKLQIAVNNGETYAGKYFELARDLDFAQNDSYKDYTTNQYGDINGTGGDEELRMELTTGTGWKPIGNTETNSFQGIFDGKEHTINNIYISNTTTSGSVGLFGVIKNANIKNLKINGTMESYVSANMGSIVGRVYGTNTIENIESNTDITGIPGSGSIGGIIGSISDATGGDDTLIHLINRGTIKEGNSTAGIIAWMQGLNTVIEDCHNFGEISQTGTSSRAGGIVGGASYMSSQSSITLKINNSSNEGRVYGHNVAGGLVGYLNLKALEVAITKSFNIGSVSGGQEVGGIAGFSTSSLLIIDRVYNSGEIRSDAGGSAHGGSGILGRTRSGSSYNTFIINSYNTGDVYNSSSGNSCGVAFNEDLAKTFIINCYNNGTIGSDGYGNGIGSATYPYNSNMIIKNAYNRGTVTWTYVGGGICLYCDASQTYDDDYLYKGQAFVDTLNSNKDTIDLSSIDSNLSGYTLCNWKLGSDNYPTLDC